MNPSDAGIYDCNVVQEVIKEIASAQILNRSERVVFKVVVLNEVDRLTKNAQHALRRTMEKYMSSYVVCLFFMGTLIVDCSCRIILQCENVSKVIEPLRSRCLAIRVAAPSHDEVWAFSAVSTKF